MTGKKAFNASQKGDIKPNAFKRLCAGLGTISTDDMEALHAQPDFGDLSEEDGSDEENDESALPSSLKKLMGVKKTKKIKNSGNNNNNPCKEANATGKVPKGADKDVSKTLDEIDRTCTVLGSDEKSAIMGKANKMHSIIAKVMKQRDADSKKKLQALMVKLQQKIFNKTSSGAKELIMQAAKVLKASEKK